MEKVFWSFPSLFEDNDKWSRLTPEVFKQVKWLYHPIDICDPQYDAIKQENKMGKKELDVAHEQFKFAQKYNNVTNIKKCHKYFHMETKTLNPLA
jgi:hypothetical protein